MDRREMLAFARKVGFKRVYRNRDVVAYEFQPTIPYAGNQNQITFTAQFWADGDWRLAQGVNDHEIDNPTYFRDIRSFSMAVDIQRSLADSHFERCDSLHHIDKNVRF